MHFLRNLTVITNSISAANELLTTAADMGLEDDNNVLCVYLPAGRVRSITLAIVSDEFLAERGVGSDIGAILAATGGADIAFVGTNGIYWDLGFTTHDLTETKTKSEMLAAASARS